MNPAQPLRIGGVTPCTMVEWGDRLCAVVFLQGCPWRCRYCHNPGLIPVDAPGALSWEQVQDLLDARRGFLDAVVFSGGEPTLQEGLPEALAVVKGLGYQVALHTNGHCPEMLGRCIDGGDLDYVAMDLKATKRGYAAITGVPESGWWAYASAELIVRSGIDHEFRTTYHPDLLRVEDLREMAGWLAEIGARAYYLQEFRKQGCGDEALNASTALPAQLPTGLADELRGPFERFGVRAAS